jgi:hypothetical protein
MTRNSVVRDAFRFRRNDTIGAAGAEQDSEFLSACFVDTGDIAVLENVEEPRFIVLGRTGAGKSALLERLKELKGERVIQIQPDNLALTYIANSTVLNTFKSLGVNLDPFFILLWRHVFTVEILSRYFQQSGSAPAKSSICSIC